MDAALYHSGTAAFAGPRLTQLSSPRLLCRGASRAHSHGTAPDPLCGQDNAEGQARHDPHPIPLPLPDPKLGCADRLSSSPPDLTPFSSPFVSAYIAGLAVIAGATTFAQIRAAIRLNLLRIMKVSLSPNSLISKPGNTFQSQKSQIHTPLPSSMTALLGDRSSQHGHCSKVPRAGALGPVLHLHLGRRRDVRQHAGLCLC